MVPGGKENVWCVVPCCVVPCHVVLGHVVLGRGAGLVCKPPSPQSDVVPLVVPCCFFFRARESCLTFSWCPPCGCSLVHLVPSLWLIWCGPIGGRWSRWSPPLTRYPMRPGGLVATGPDPESVSRPRSRSRSRPRSYPDAGPGPGPDPDPAAGPDPDPDHILMQMQAQILIQIQAQIISRCRCRPRPRPRS